MAFWGAIASLFAGAARAGGVEVSPLTDRIVLVRVTEGHVVHHVSGQARSDERVVIDPLDVEAVVRPGFWAVSGRGDPAFARPVNPRDMGRKSKGTDFAWFVDSWVDDHAVNTRPDHVKTHWLYLFLPRPMKTGGSYTVRAARRVAGAREWNFVFGTARSEAVHVNVIGYAPRAPAKYAYVFHWAGDRGGLDLAEYAGREFRVVDLEGGKAAFRGKVAFRAPADMHETFHKTDSPPDGSFLKAPVWECDFSAFSSPGRYAVEVDGIGRSFPFRIDADAYREAFRTTARGLYHNRSGIALERRYTDFPRPAPHNPRLTPGFAGKLVYTTVRFTEWGSEGGEAKRLLAHSCGPVETAGWYQDAGDWDSYYPHLRVAQELLLAYELAPRNFTDGELGIPESGNGVPDILDEAAWLPRFCVRLRRELVERKYGTGGVGLRIAGDAFGSDEGTKPDGGKFGRGSWEDTDRTWAASGEDPWSTYRYAGTAAHLAWCLGLAGVADPEGIDWKAEAVESYSWAEANTQPGDEAVGDPPLREARAYAAAALFRLTGEAAYERRLAADMEGVAPDAPLWDERRYAAMVHALGGGPGRPDPALMARVRGAVMATADEIAVATPGRRALRWGGNWHMPMLIGQQTTPWLIEAAVAHVLALRDDPERAGKYLAALYTTCDYFLGGNSLNTTWVTGLGPRCPVHVFHMDAWYNGRGAFHPGIIPYGPWLKGRDLGQGPWDAAWPHKTLHPPIDEWPGNERWFDNRCAPLNAEFTIHQNTAPAAALFGFLCAPGPGPGR